MTRLYTAAEARALRKAARLGPWVPGQEEFRACVYPCTGAGVDVPIADCCESHATATLMAAAPDLAATVEHLHAQLAQVTADRDAALRRIAGGEP